MKIKKSDEKTAYYKTKIGNIEIRYSAGNITYIGYAKGCVDTDSSEKNDLSDNAIIQINEYLDGKRKDFDLPIMPIGTEFQRMVWKALCDIPYGKTVSYKEIAEKIGRPKSARAVGMANNRNKISIVIPCHRVIGSNGKLVGYGGGLDKKNFLLELERNNE